ncbi:DoxX family protein [Paracoccus sp. SCSIO 75233]|uniref:DoxX family protein n=1 Tax=Paracoccus sp. SCSIO 75233 TaxID=3017782 RepID=UPI0022F12B7B|nr:DoxX family protein [Paracoccus sp. SCSIO 75233]WBU54295.1 DoxX family protein [Paracoccus sp. SCSIO 75233]
MSRYDRHQTRLILPFMGPFYENFAKPLAHLGLRVVVGVMLMMEGWPKIVAPFAQAGFTESLGFYPGWFWSAALAVMQFVGGLMIVVGFLTRPVVLANAVMLAVTLWFHVTHPYGDVFLSPEGMQTLSENAALFSEAGLANLRADGGALFLAQVQSKAEDLSLLWTVAALFLAAFGAGPISVDRTILKREF